MTGVDTFQSPRGQRNIARILAALADERMTCTRLMDKLCMGHTTAKRYLAHLQAKETRQIRVAGYERTGGRKAPLFAIGTGRDAPCPPRDDRQERSARERALRAADKDKEDRHYARKRVIDKIRRAKVKKAPTTWLSVLM